MTKEFLKEQNIAIENTWVCHDTKRNVRTVDIEQLLEDYYEWKVKKLNKPCVIKSVCRHEWVNTPAGFVQCYYCKKYDDN